MYGYDFNFGERMQEGRANAAARRHRGEFSGKAAKGWNYKRREPDKGSHEEAAAKVVVAWQCARARVLDQLQDAIMGDQRAAFAAEMEGLIW